MEINISMKLGLCKPKRNLISSIGIYESKLKPQSIPTVLEISRRENHMAQYTITKNE